MSQHGISFVSRMCCGQHLSLTSSYARPFALAGSHALFALLGYQLSSYMNAPQPPVDLFKELTHKNQSLALSTTLLSPLQGGKPVATSVVEHMRNSVLFADHFIKEAQKDREDAAVTRQQLKQCLKNTEEVMEVCRSNAEALQVELKKDLAKHIVDAKAQLQSCQRDLQDTIAAKAKCWMC